MRSLVLNSKKVIGYNIQAVSSDAVLNGNAIDISVIEGTGAEVSISLMTGVVATGNIQVQDVQFSNDNTFATGVTTVGASYIEHFIKGDVSSDTDALTQTKITTANTLKVVGLHIPVAGLKYMRVRLLSDDTASLTAGVLVEMTQQRVPVKNN